MSSLAYQQVTAAEQPFWKQPFALNWQGIENEIASQLGCLTTFQPNDWLFRAGDEKVNCFRIEAGVVSLSSWGPDGTLICSRLAFPGEYLGLGFLSTHRISAMAVIATTVTSFSADELEELATNDADVALRDHAVRQEFEQLRNDTVA